MSASIRRTPIRSVAVVVLDGHLSGRVEHVHLPLGFGDWYEASCGDVVIVAPTSTAALRELRAHFSRQAGGEGRPEG